MRLCYRVLEAAQCVDVREVLAARHCLSRTIFIDGVSLFWWAWCVGCCSRRPQQCRGVHNARRSCARRVCSFLFFDSVNSSPRSLPLLVEQAYQPFIRYKYYFASPPCGLIYSRLAFIVIAIAIGHTTPPCDVYNYNWRNNN